MEKWYIVHTRSRWEKKLTDVFVQKGIESYCPVKTVKHKWSDRIKTIEEPLFKCYVFVKIVPEQKTAVRLTEGVINFVYRNGKAALVKEKEIKAFKKYLDADIRIKWSEKNSIALMPERDGKNRQRDAFQFYLDSFNSRLTPATKSLKIV